MTQKYPFGFQPFERMRKGYNVYLDKTDYIYRMVDRGIKNSSIDHVVLAEGCEFPLMSLTQYYFSVSKIGRL